MSECVWGGLPHRVPKHATNHLRTASVMLQCQYIMAIRSALELGVEIDGDWYPLSGLTFVVELTYADGSTAVLRDCTGRSSPP